MGMVFISYRRHDSSGYVRALVNEMKRTFGEGQAFLDMESINVGADFVAAIEQAVRNSEVLLVIIGPAWVSIADEQGRRRLDDPDDFVRLEILSAFSYGIPIIPVMLDDTPMPAEDNLPEELKPLAKLQALRLSHSRWENDIDWLFRGIEVVTEEPRLAREYIEANALARLGLWQEAMTRFQAIVSRRPAFRDNAERLQPLEKLAGSSARLGAARGGWRRAVIRFPIVPMLFLGISPNIAAGAFNYIYNWRIIVHPMQLRGVAKAESYFEATSALVNTVAFALGISMFTHLAWPVRGALRSVVTVAIKPAQDPFLAGVRRRCLSLGHLAALLGAGMWLVAGPIYPALIGGMELSEYAFFTASLFFCGLIASVYPFFGVTCLCIRVFYAELIRPGTASSADLAHLEKLDSRTWTYLMLAGSLPMLAIATGLVLSPLANSTANSFLLGVLGLTGFAGFMIAIWLFRKIQSDLAVLKQVVIRSTPTRL